MPNRFLDKDGHPIMMEKEKHPSTPGRAHRVATPGTPLENSRIGSPQLRKSSPGLLRIPRPLSQPLSPTVFSSRQLVAKRFHSWGSSPYGPYKVHPNSVIKSPQRMWRNAPSPSYHFRKEVLTGREMFKDHEENLKVVGDEKPPWNEGFVKAKDFYFEHKGLKNLGSFDPYTTKTEVTSKDVELRNKYLRKNLKAIYGRDGTAPCRPIMYAGRKADTCINFHFTGHEKNSGKDSRLVRSFDQRNTPSPTLFLGTQFSQPENKMNKTGTLPLT